MLLVFLVASYRAWRGSRTSRCSTRSRASAPGGYVVVGLAALVSGAPFLTNLLGPGAGTLLSGGSMPFLNWAVGDRGRRGDPDPLHASSSRSTSSRSSRGRRRELPRRTRVAAWICVVGLYGIVTSRNLIHLALCLTVTQSSTYVLLLAVGYVHGGGAPIFKGVKLGTTAVDPVVQALTLTDIVVSVTVIALILALALDVAPRLGTIDPDELAELQRMSWMLAAAGRGPAARGGAASPRSTT